MDGLDARYLALLPRTRSSANTITISSLLDDRPDRENFVLLLSHDEVVHGKRSLLGKCPATIGKSLPISDCYWAKGMVSRGKLLLRTELACGGRVHDDQPDWELLDRPPTTQCAVGLLI
jgi:1,4-alpha-glucan branching enzyme